MPAGETKILSCPKSPVQSESPLAVNVAHQILGGSFSFISTKEYSLIWLRQIHEAASFSRLVKRNVEFNPLIISVLL